jgi:site-specific DNA-methyltransferase (adenine-specific)
MENTIQLFNDDCFNVFKNLPDKSVDCVIVDLPYGQTACHWDCMIDLDEMWKHLKRVCKKKCNYVFFTTTKFGYQLIKSNEKWFRYDLIWVKSRKVGFLSANKMPLRKHEIIYVFGNKSGGKKTYNPQKIKLDKPYIDKRQGDNIKNVYNQTQKRSNNGVYTHKHPGSVLEYNNPSKPVHRTQKPVDLCEFLVKSYSNEGDVIMDFTMGSGTTGVACVNSNRKFIGVEKDEDIFKIAKKRIKK